MHIFFKLRFFQKKFISKSDTLQKLIQKLTQFEIFISKSDAL